MRRPYRRCLIHLSPAPFNPPFDVLWQAHRPVRSRGDRPVAPTASVVDPERDMFPLDSRFHGNDEGGQGDGKRGRNNDEGDGAGRCVGAGPYDSLSLRPLEQAEGSKGWGVGAKAEVTSEFVSMFRQAQHIASSTNLGMGKFLSLSKGVERAKGA